VKKEDVHVEVDNDILTISGERSDEREQESHGYYTSERSYGQFYRAIVLPDGTNADQCDASFKDGVLEITLNVPTEQGKQSRKIQVR
jgi:HSP20 family protein